MAPGWNVAHGQGRRPDDCGRPAGPAARLPKRYRSRCLNHAGNSQRSDVPDVHAHRRESRCASSQSGSLDDSCRSGACVSHPDHSQISMTDLTRSKKKARLRRLLEAQTVAATVIPRVEHRVLTAEHEPLSFAQQGLWFVSQLEGPNPAYNNSIIVRISGALHQDALNRAMSSIVQRHGSLRTRFVEQAGVLSQICDDVDEVPLGMQSVAAEEAEAVFLAEARRTFDIGKDLLFRAKLYQESSQRFVLIVSMHHIISDAWSVGLFIRELAALYEAYSCGREISLDALPVTYIDYVHWERNWLDSGVLERQLDYWREQLKDLPQPASVPPDMDGALYNRAGGTIEFSVPTECLHGLKSLSKEHNCSLFVTLLTGFAVVLHRYSSQADLAIGTGVSNRRTTELEGLIGFFVNTLVLRLAVLPHQSYESVLKAARAVFLQALANQDAPYHRVIQELPAQSRTGASPLFQTIFTFQNVDWHQRITLPSLTMELELPSSGAAKFDLSISVQDRSQGLCGQIEYRSGIFEEATVRRFAGHYTRVLEEITAHPEWEIGRFVLLSEAEFHALSYEWSGSQRVQTPGRNIHAIFETRVRENPDAVAVVHCARSWTYGELDATANRLAGYLKKFGVNKDTLVGVCVERSLDLIATFLAVLKAGGAYLPLDAESPAERLREVLYDSGAKLLLTTTTLCKFVPADAVQTVLVDKFFASIDASCHESDYVAPAGEVDENALAYVMYTSGSTGAPKGVAVAHKGVTRLVTAPDWIELDAKTVTILHSPVAFDASTFEIWAPLLNGGTLVLQQGQSADVPGLAQEVVQHSVNTLWLSASVLPLWLDEPKSREIVLRYLLAGGDVVSEKHVQEIYAHDPRVTVINGYGPTENTTFSCCYPVPRARIPRGSLPIGKPIKGSSAYVLDDNMRMQPIGCIGELYVGGAGLARGYWNKPNLTAESFVNNPFSADGQDRLYKTGDKARWRNSGEIEFLGRVDNQVKIRGYRAETEEIEFRLMQLPEIRQAAVVLREHTQLGKQLVAYIVPAQNSVKDQNALISQCKASLRKSLPEYMVPAAIVVLEELPLNANGKLDRKGLPAPEMGGGVRRAGRTPEEEILAGLFAAVLHLEGVCIGEKFCGRGGHSLLATRLISRIRSSLGGELGIRTLFEAPTVASLAQQLPGAQRARVRLRAGPRPEVIPLSSGQKRLWFLHQMEGPSATYNVPVALRLEGELKVEALRQGMEDVVKRHEILRTVFAEDREGPRQRILKVEETGGYFEQEEVGEEELGKRLEEVARYGFDLRREIPLRVWLLKVKEEEHVLVLLQHHIATDGWSMEPLLRDLGVAYEARRRGEGPGWKDLAVQYADYSLWQAEQLGERRVEAGGLGEQMEYWKEKLKGAPEEMELLRDRARGEESSYRGGEVGFRVSGEVHEGLVKLGREHGASLFMVLQAGLAALLTRLGCGEDIVLGSAIAGRTEEALNDLVGFFVNTLVLRSDTSGNPSYAELLGRVREDDLNAYAHQDVPFEYLVEVLNPVRTLNRHPLFQVMLVLQNTGGAEIVLPGVKVSMQGVGVAPAKFDLTFNLREDRRGGVPQGIVGQINYALDLFEAGTVVKLGERLERVLEAVVQDAGQRVGEIEILSASERRQIVEEWNQTGHEVAEVCLAELFEAEVEKNPDRTAVVFEHQMLSYGELNRRANQLAHLLIGAGIGPESIVGLALPRSLEMIIGVLGILKAGGAYVPLDPVYPRERLAFMLSDARPACLLTVSSLLDRLPEDGAIAQVVLDSGPTRHQLAGMSPSNPQQHQRICPLLPSHAAYVIYTSGSTGAPKGVTVTHAGIATLSAFQADRLVVNGESRVLQFSSPSFDASFWEIVMALTAGAVLAIARDEDRDGSLLQQMLIDRAVTHATLTPTVALTLREDIKLPLACLIVAGEACPSELAARWCNGRRMINAYGPTEVTVCAAMSDPLEGRAAPSIGGPIWNTQLYILDDRYHPVAPGIPGELFVAGAGLARGYQKRAELTGERFVPNPFAGAGERMYRTGDLGRWLPDGNIEFLGRNDLQVKIRGFRIELGEIEAVLRGYEGVGQAAALVREDHPGHRQLVGYVTAPGGRVDTGELRSYLREHLPEYMVPAAIVVLEELPLNANGKLDRKGLPAPEMGGGVRRAGRTPEEEILAGLFAEVLHLEGVGIEDNFFELGGHSLLATRLISRIRSILGVELGIRTLFEAPTVASLAQQLPGAQRARVRLRAGPRPEVIPLSSGQKRLWFLHQMEGPSATYNVPVALRLEGELKVEALRQGMEDVVKRHEILRTVFAEDREGPRQRILKVEETGGYFEQEEVGEEELGKRLEEVARYGFDLRREIPLRVWLLKVKEEEHVLVLLQHHIATDGWSMEPLLRDLGVAYEARRRGEGPGWKDLAVQYADYSLWQAEQLGERRVEAGGLGEQMEYWKEKLKGAPEEMELLRDRARGEESSYRGGEVGFRVSGEVHEGLVKLGREHGASLFMVLQAGLAALLTRLGCGEDIVLGSAIAGRTEEALNDLVGFFVNTLVLRSDTSGNPSYAELLGRVREDDLNAYAHQDVPFEYLVEVLNPVRTLNRHPLFQVMLVLQNTGGAEIVLPGVKVSMQGVGVAPAKFDLTFNLREDRRGGVPQGIVGQINYALDLFEAGTVVKLGERLERVLEAVVQDAGQRVGEIEILSASERRQIVEEWNQTGHEVAEVCLAELFEAEVEKNPDRTAVV